jgi:hypothetical protein
MVKTPRPKKVERGPDANLTRSSSITSMTSAPLVAKHSRYYDNSKDRRVQEAVRRSKNRVSVIKAKQ